MNEQGQWKYFLKAYLERLNQEMVAGRANRQESMPQIFWDDRDQQREVLHWERHVQQLKQRNAHPLAAKIAAEPIRVKPFGPDHVEVVLRVHQELCYMQGDKVFQENQSGFRRVHLRRVNEEWRFDKPWESTWGPEHRIEQVQPLMELAELFAVPVNQTQSRGYDRLRAVAYADTFWNSPNPAYPYFTDDCTNFISQCVHAGNIPMVDTGNKTTGWWMRGGKSGLWSYSWTVAHSFHALLASGRPPMYAERKKSPEELELGDIICYDFDGDGRWQHNTIVTAKDENGMPLVNAHTTNSSRRYWEYTDSSAYTDNIKYDFYHIRGKA